MPRDYLHDYRSRCIYHITLSKQEGIPEFARISGNLDAQGRVENQTHFINPIGSLIIRHIVGLPKLCDKIQVYQHIVMPDHVHFLIFVKEYLDMHLGNYIGKMKVRITQEAAEKLGIPGPIFQNDYYDRRLKQGDNLNAIFTYIKRNPYRLLVRILKRDFFRRIYNFNINGIVWESYGNFQLYGNPFKYQVVVHRRDSDEDFRRNLQTALYYASNGGVVISPFISEREKAIRDEVIEAGGKMILLVNTPFGERYRPGGRYFELCEEGRLLIIAPKAPLPAGREGFLYLNALAESIARDSSAPASLALQGAGG